MRKFLAVLILLSAARFSHAQYALYQTCTLTNAFGQAINGAQVYFLTQPANIVTLTPLASVFTSATGGAATQPLKTNGFGTCTAYLSPGTYTVCYISSATGKRCLPDQAISAGGSGGGTVSGQTPAAIPLATAATAIGKSSPLSVDDINAPTKVSSTVPLVVPSAILTGLGSSTSPVCPNGVSGALTTSGCASGSGTVNSGQLALAQYPTSTGTSVSPGNFTYDAATGNNLTIGTSGAGRVFTYSAIASGFPTPDMRSPAFASGSLCNDSFDNAPAFNAMLAALPIKGGRTQIIGGFAGGTSCRIMPTNITWPASTGPVNIYIQGKLRIGTTLWLNKATNSSAAPINLLGFAGGTSAQFQTTIEPANIELSPSSGTCMGLLGTAVSTPEGTGLAVTVTPSTPPSSNPCLQVGTWMTIADTTACTISTISRTSNIVTAVFSASCHVLQGTPITLASVTDTSFNSGVVFTGQLTSGSPTVTFSSGSPLAGQWIRATNVVSGIPSNTYIVSVGSGTLTMSNNASNSNSISLTTNTYDFNNTAAGMLATSSDWCGDVSHACQMTWKQPGPDATSSGGTLTAFTPDTIEHVNLTAITSTTMSFTAFRSHSSAAQFGVDAVVLGNDGTGSTADISASSNTIRDIAIINNYGTCLSMPGAYKALVEKSGCFTSGPFNSGNYANWALEIGAASYVTMTDSSFITNGPYSIHMTQRWNDGAASSGPLYMAKDFFSGVYMDHGAAGLSITDSSTEHLAGSLITFNVANYWDGNPTWYKLDNVNSQDAFLSNGALYYVTPSYSLSQAGTAEMRNVGVTGCLVNSYYNGKLNNVLPGQNKWDCNNTETRGIWGTFNDGKNFDGSYRGSGANFSPSIVPHATVAVTAPGTWTGCSTITTGQKGPDGTNSATLLTNSASTCLVRVFQSASFNPVVGDQVLFGGWIYTPTLDQPVNLGGSTFSVDNSASGNWSFSGNGGQQVQCDIFDSLLLNDWYKPVVCYGRVISVASPGVTTGTWRMFLQGSAGMNKLYAYPWAMYIPASEGISQTEVMRWRAQLLHGYVPASATTGEEYSLFPITLPGDPTNTNEAATKHYVDSHGAGVSGPGSAVVGHLATWGDTSALTLLDGGAAPPIPALPFANPALIEMVPTFGATSLQTPYAGCTSQSTGAGTIPTVNNPYLLNIVSGSTSGNCAAAFVGASNAPNPQYWQARNPVVKWGFGFSASTDYTSSARIWIGLVGNGCTLATLTGSDTPLCSYGAIRWSTAAADATWECVSDNGTAGGPTVTAIGATVPNATYQTATVAITASGVTCTVGGTSVTNLTRLPSGQTFYNILSNTTLAAAGTHIRPANVYGYHANGSF